MNLFLNMKLSSGAKKISIYVVAKKTLPKLFGQHFCFRWF